MKYVPTIGLEIHAELKTHTKMFCGSLNDPDEKHPNVNVCPICMGHPGTLPAPNKEAIWKTIQLGLALNAKISDFAQFDRKNYFYPDLPKGYQISQYPHPMATAGFLHLNSGKQVRIRRVHLEEDTGKLFHDGKATLVDFNRAGVPLLELVTEPDLDSADEVREFGEELQRILRYLDASSADMEKGQLRVEVNISLKQEGGSEDGVKVEIKNINSFRFAADAVNYEIERQTALLEKGEKIIQETRGWDERKNASVAQRQKEESQDYRYFPEPDIPPLRISAELVDEIRSALPELPGEKLRRFVDEFGIDAKLVLVLVQDKSVAGFFEAAVSELKEWLTSRGSEFSQKPLQLAANYLTTDFAKLLSDAGTPINESVVTPENFAELITYIYEGKISSRSAKEVLKEMFASGADPSIVIDERKLWQVSEGDEISSAVDKVIAANAKAADDYRAGKTAILQFLVGQVMKEVKGANPETVKKLLEEGLK